MGGSSSSDAGMRNAYNISNRTFERKISHGELWRRSKVNSKINGNDLQEIGCEDVE